MSIQIVVPIKNYYEGVLNIISWCNQLQSSHKIQVLLVDDESSYIYDPLINKIKGIPWISFVRSSDRYRGDIKRAYKLAYLEAKKNHSEHILTVESDAIPSTTVLNRFLETYNFYKHEKIASFSTMYKWQGEFCYPNAHWDTDKTFALYRDIGLIVETHAVPFLFTLWNTDVFDFMNEGMPKLYQLDTKFGLECGQKGYKHLRLKDHFIEHVGGGKQSQKCKDYKEDLMKAELIFDKLILWVDPDPIGEGS